MWVGENTGHALVFSKWNAIPAVPRVLLAGYFNPTIDHSAPESILFYTPSSGVVSVGRVTTSP